MKVNDEIHFLRGEIKELKELLVIIAHNQHQTVATPVFSFDDTDSELTIACGTTGATIHYTTDGSTPTVESDIYSEPIAITEACTVKAFAAKLDMNDSAVASGTFEPTPEPEPEGDTEG